MIMKKELIEQNKAKLLAQKEQLRKLLLKEGPEEGKGEFPGDFKPTWPKIGDKEDENASEVSQYETSLSLTRDLEEKLTRIEDALMRIEKGTYGICKMGDKIEQERLSIIPEADTCIKHSRV